MVYSTCSFNPIEDEAVVAEVSTIYLKSFIAFQNLFHPPSATIYAALHTSTKNETKPLSLFQVRLPGSKL